MPYFPEHCFDLIKGFAGIHPAKYHQKKIATMIDDSVDYWKEARQCGELIPLVYEIKFGEEYLENWKAGFPQLIYGESARDLKDYHEALSSLGDFKFTHSFELYLLTWNKVYAEHSQNAVWLKLTTKPSTTLNSDGLFSSQSRWPVKVPELKQFCIDNNIPKKKYSTLNKQELITLIQHYNFD